jgi:transcriptional regulator with XRE-family HTH domain
MAKIPLRLFRRAAARVLHDARVAAGLTLEDAARRAGMDAARLTAVEDATADIDSYRLMCLADAFGVPQARLWERIERHVRRRTR